MAVTQSDYHPSKIERIHQILHNQQQHGKNSDYEITVDTFKVVPRTDDIAQFDTYSKFIDADTKSLTITLFHGVSNRNDKHIFRMQPEPEPALNGIENVDEKIQEKLNKERAKWRKKKLENKHKKLKKAHQALEKAHQELQKELAIAKSNKHKIGNLNIGELGSVIVEGIVRRNPQILSSLPGGEALAGAFQADNTAQENQPATYEEATFSKKKAKQKTLSQEDQALLEFGKQLQERFSQEEILQIMQLLDYLALDKTQIQVILEKIAANHFYTQEREENTSINHEPDAFEKNNSPSLEGDP